MSTIDTSNPAPARQGNWLSRRLRSAGRGAALHLSSYPGFFAYCFALTALALMAVGIGIYVLPTAMASVRSTADTRRRRLREWLGITVDSPYRVQPEFPQGAIGRLQRSRWLLTDPATRRDLQWLLLDPFVSLGLALLPLALILEGVYGFVVTAFNGLLTDHGMDDWYLFIHVHQGMTAPWATALVGAFLIPLGLAMAPGSVARYGRWTSRRLAPTPAMALAQRVEHLATTRTDAVDTQASELRRIERDLHDGAQARLVAMGMTLGSAVHLMDTNPEAARALMVEARDTSARALNELRDLVRGIHPPVLSDRGLGDAVRALALDSALPVEVTVDLPGRPPLPVESAAYFAVAEALANAAKHSGAHRVWIDLHHTGERLLMTVRDDGIGGADLTGGTGLRGIERRLATFDGILALSSPEGGPTVVTVELPCVLSSPKTSSS